MKPKDLKCLLMHGTETANTDDYESRFYSQQEEVQKDRGTAHKNGVVYTPVSCVDFINQSVNSILQREFGVSMDSPDVEILDPFAGTGIFLCRAVENGLIDPEKQTVRQIELMPDSADIARRNIEISLKKAGRHGQVETLCADTFTLDPVSLESGDAK